jgi:hypothetical protein
MKTNVPNGQPAQAITISSDFGELIIRIKRISKKIILYSINQFSHFLNSVK